MSISTTTNAQARRDVAAGLGRIVAKAKRKGLSVSPTFPTTKLRILGESTKVDKGLSHGVLTAVLYLAPSTESGIQTCPWATDACSTACLGHSTGRLAMDSSANARAWKTALFFGDRPLFMALLRSEIRAHEAKAKRLGMVAAVRLDGSSDLGIGRKLAPEFEGVQFYGYTKSVKRALKAARGGFGSNYHATFSYSGSNGRDATRVLRAGGTVAVVFATKPHTALPARWRGWPVVDGDETDIRFEDPPGHVVGLSFKQGSGWDDAVKAAGRFAQPVKGRRLPVSCGGAL